MKKAFFLFCLQILLIDYKAIGQLCTELNVPGNNYVRKNRWKASWITHPDLILSEYGVALFRKEIELKAYLEEYIIHISADNRYRLYVNGKLACFGPQLSDIRHWRYETINIASFLNKGKNSIAVEVVNFGQDRFFGQISLKTALVIQGFSEQEAQINTDDKTWKSYINTAYSPKHPNWMYSVDIVGGFYASNPGDSVNSNYYPWGWILPDYDDSKWKTAKWLSGSSTFGGGFNWLLMPRSTPIQKDTLQRLSKIAKSVGLTIKESFLRGSAPVTVPPNTLATILIDQTYLTLGYPELKVSGGKDADIKITYAENLYNKDKTKGNRNDLKDKIMIGLFDKYFLDGGKDRVYKPLWFRSFRFIQLEIQTKNEPLVLNDYYNVFSAAPLKKKASFSSDNHQYDKIMDICWRTASTLTQDNLVSDAYYEQMQYVGDSRVHAMTNLYMTGDETWLKNAIDQFNYSRLPDGMITSCYPLKATFVHPTFTLIWIDMVHDYMMHRDDMSFVKKQLSNIQQSLYWFEDHLNSNGLLGKSEWDYFVDWYKGDQGGTAKISHNGNSAVVTLHYIYTLQNASRIFSYCGKTYEADQYKARADDLKKKVYDLCFDQEKQMFYEDPGKTFGDQRPNIMAVLTDAIPLEKQKLLIEKIVKDTVISQAGMYYRFNLFNAMAKSESGNMFEASLNPWKTLLNMGLTTTTEVPLDLNQRSEAHPWSTSPAMAFFSVVCGISPAEPGFKTVKISPQLGNLKFVNASFAHYKGDIKVELKKSGKAGIEGQIILPNDLTGSFFWNGKSVNLISGINKIKQL